MKRKMIIDGIKIKWTKKAEQELKKFHNINIKNYLIEKYKKEKINE